MTTNANAKDLKAIINNTTLRPMIVNEDSKFVIITYWWGRKNMNANMQKPCREDLAPGEVPTTPPMLFEDMIDRWIDFCKKAKCNYLVQEYPEFVGPGGYQMAINAKPLFIKKALESCERRAVVYIDGDMTVNQYPHIFDMENVDYMARGWNIDYRGNPNYKEDTCYDPFTFETSGGIMYFADSLQARDLLKQWAIASSKKQNAGKADDRIISLYVNRKSLYIDINIVQLPIEFLWLTDIYEPSDSSVPYLDKKDYSRSMITFEHPACLTTEEIARDQGAAADRQPKFYNTLVEKFLNCNIHGGVYFEYIMFENEAQMMPFEKYHEFISTPFKISLEKTDKPYTRILFKNVYGPFNKVAFANSKIADNTIMPLLNAILVAHHHIIKGVPIKLVYSEKSPLRYDPKNRVMYSDNIVPAIIAILSRRYSVVYMPKKYDLVTLGIVLDAVKKDRHELIVNTADDNNIDIHFDAKSPIYFSPNSRVLMHLLKITKHISFFEDTLSMCKLFIQLIRCDFLRWHTIIDDSPKKARSLDRSKKDMLVASDLGINVNDFSTIRAYLSPVETYFKTTNLKNKVVRTLAQIKNSVRTERKNSQPIRRLKMSTMEMTLVTRPLLLPHPRYGYEQVSVSKDHRTPKQPDLQRGRKEYGYTKMRNLLQMSQQS